MRTSLLWFVLTLMAIAALTAVGPAEQSLGTNVRVVYLHGAWVWAALISILAAGLTGLAGLITQRESAHNWSLALGRTGLVFWITYLPISLWAMQANWNGLFLAEPRWRLALYFAVGGLLLQVGITLIDKPVWASCINLAYALILVYALQTTEQVMHPGSPIFSSSSWRIQAYFIGLTALTLLAAWQMTRLLLKADASSSVQSLAVDS
jgi:hypothetical protein